MIHSRTGYRSHLVISRCDGDSVTGFLGEIGNKHSVASKGYQTGIGGDSIAPVYKVVVGIGRCEDWYLRHIIICTRPTDYTHRGIGGLTVEAACINHKLRL